MNHVTKNIFTITILLFSMNFISAGVDIGEDPTDAQGVIITQVAAAIINTFLGLTDTPNSYSGEGGNCVAVNVGETFLEFIACAAGGGGAGGSKWEDNGNFIQPNSTFADNIFVDGWINSTNWDNATAAMNETYLDLSGNNSNSNIDFKSFNISTLGFVKVGFIGSPGIFIAHTWTENLTVGNTLDGDFRLNTSQNITSPLYCTGTTCGNISDFLKVNTTNEIFGVVDNLTFYKRTDGNLGNTTDVIFGVCDNSSFVKIGEDSTTNATYATHTNVNDNKTFDTFFDNYSLNVNISNIGSYNYFNSSTWNNIWNATLFFDTFFDNYSLNVNISNIGSYNYFNSSTWNNIWNDSINLTGQENINISINGWYPSLFVNQTWLNATIDDKLVSITYFPTSNFTLFGTESGGNNIGNLSFIDGQTFNITENVGGDALELHINFTGVSTIPDFITTGHQYLGSHTIQLEIWDYEDLAWEVYDVISQQESVIKSNIALIDGGNHVQNEIVQIRFTHPSNGIPSHLFLIDFVNLIDGFSTVTTTKHDGLSNRAELENHPQYLDIDGTRNMTMLNVSGNVSASFYFGNGSLLTSLPSADGSTNASYALHSDVISNMSAYGYYNDTLTNSTQFEDDSGTLSILWSWLDSFVTNAINNITYTFSQIDANILGNKTSSTNDTWQPNQTRVEDNIALNGSLQWHDQDLNTTNDVIFADINSTANINIEAESFICLDVTCNAWFKYNVSSTKWMLNKSRDQWIISNDSGVYIKGG